MHAGIVCDTTCTGTGNSMQLAGEDSLQQKEWIAPDRRARPESFRSTRVSSYSQSLRILIRHSPVPRFSLSTPPWNVDTSKLFRCVLTQRKKKSVQLLHIRLLRPYCLICHLFRLSILFIFSFCHEPELNEDPHPLDFSYPVVDVSPSAIFWRYRSTSVSIRPVPFPPFRVCPPQDLIAKDVVDDPAWCSDGYLARPIIVYSVVRENAGFC